MRATRRHATRRCGSVAAYMIKVFACLTLLVALVFPAKEGFPGVARAAPASPRETADDSSGASLRGCEAMAVCLVSTDPLPEQFTASAVFSWQPREAGERVGAAGLSLSPDGPPTALALSLAVEQPPSFFGTSASVQIASDAGLLGEMTTKVEQAGAREVYDTGATALLRPARARPM